jgi:Predicted secreted protein
MKMLRRILLLIVLAGLLVPTVGCGSKQIILTSADNGKKLNVKAGEQIVVELDGNPSTGYTWEAQDLDASMIRQVGEAEFKSSNPGVIGAGRTLTLKFMTLQAGTTSLALVYHRPWETGVKPLSSFTTAITVK